MKKALKIIAVTLLLIAAVVPAQAQRRVIHYLPKYEQEPYHFGFLLAYNQMMYTVKTVEDYQNVPQPANSWPNGNYNIPSTQNLYVSLSFSERRMRYDVAVKNLDGEITMKSFTKSIGTTFVEFPLNIKYRSKRYNNIGAYLMGGVNPKIDLASQKDNKETDGQGNEFINNLVTKRFDVAGEIGAGFDIYNQWFKMGIEVKMSYGLLDIVKNEAFIYTAPIDKLRNKLFQVSLIVE